MLNKVHLIGNLGDEIKMHYFENGGCVGNVSIATSSSYTNKQTGEKVVDTQWHNLVFRNKGAEIAEKYISKGDQIYIEGRLQYRKYEADGVTKTVAEVHVFEFKFLRTKKINNTQVNDPVAVPTNENDNLPF